MSEPKFIWIWKGPKEELTVCNQRLDPALATICAQGICPGRIRGDCCFGTDFTIHKDFARPYLVKKKLSRRDQRNIREAREKQLKKNIENVTRMIEKNRKSRLNELKVQLNHIQNKIAILESPINISKELKDFDVSRRQTTFRIKNESGKSICEVGDNSTVVAQCIDDRKMKSMAQLLATTGQFKNLNALIKNLR